MPKETTYLFRLIKSMTPGEKRYFKIFSEKYVHENGKKYMALFDAMDAQKEYDVEVLKEQLNSEVSLSRSAFTNAKNRLYRNILRCLSIYGAESDHEEKLNQYILHATILFRRNLLTEARRALNAARKLAQEQELFSYFQRIIDLEMDIMVAQGRIQEIDEKFLDTYKRELSIQKSYDRILAIKFLRAQVYDLFKKNSLIRNEEENHAFQVILSDPLLINGARAATVTERINYFRIQLYYCLARRNDYKAAYGYASEFINLFEQNPQFKTSERFEYIGALANGLRASVDAGRFDTYAIYAKQLKEIALADNDSFAMALLYMNEFYYYYKVGQTEAGIKRIRDVEKRFLSTEKDIPGFIQIVSYLFAAFNFFMAQKFRDCKQWCNRVFLHEQFEEDTVFGRTVHFLMLLTYYELGDHVMLLSQISRVRSLLKKTSSLYRGEKILLDALKKLVNLQTKSEKLAAFQTLEKDLLRLSETKYDGALLEDFDYLGWVRWHISD